MVDDKNSFIKGLKNKITSLIYDTHAEIVRNTPVDTGRLRSSIIVEEQTDGFIIGTNVEYAPFVELDTKPHVIRPVNAKALRFKAGGKVVFAKKVNHPGTTGHHMFLKGVQYFESKLKGLK